MEVLAPAGSIASLKSAVAAGADAVYLGLGEFSARSKASEFDATNIKQWIEYCHFFRTKVYVAINILIKDSEMQKAISLAKLAWDSGADAIIVQDYGFLIQLHSTLPHIVLHASTQMGIHNLLGAQFAQRHNIKRIILSRETTLEDIRLIRQNTDIEIEAFVHGALCVSFSGNCYFSSVVSSYSGNRGRCLQLCRKKYSISGKDGFWLSTKDLYLGDQLDKLKEAGVCSIKIEGRLRRPEYVFAVTRHYKALLSGEKPDLDSIRTLFNRGDYTDGFLFDPTANTIYPHTPSHIGMQIGTVERVQNSIAKIKGRSLQKGDGLKFFRDRVEVGHCEVGSEGSQTTFVGDVQAGDTVSLTTCASQIRLLTDQQPKLAVSLDFYVQGQTAFLRATALTDQTTEITLSADIVSPARSAPMHKSDIIAQLSKLGDTDFSLSQANVTLNGDVFIPKSSLNQLRRDALSALRQAILSGYKRPAHRTDTFNPTRSMLIEYKTIIQVDNIDILPLVQPHADCIAYQPKEYQFDDVLRFCRACKLPVLLTTPNIARHDDLAILEQISKIPELVGCIAQNPYAVELFRGKQIVLGQLFNIINSHADLPSIAGIDSQGVPKTDYLCVFSHLPLMHFAHCPRQNNCQACDGKPILITDSLGYTFTIERTQIAHCYHRLLNTIPLCLTHKAPPSAKRFFDFCSTTPQQIADILAGKLPKQYTTANFGKSLS